MIDRIVIPLDRSALSEIALPFGMMLARTLDCSVDFLHVLAERSDIEAAGANVYLSRIIDRFPPPSNYQMLVRNGDAAETILEVAGDSGALIVMATHGYGGLRRLFLGSVADSVVRKAMVPVALVRGEPDFRLPQQTLRRLLVPLDGSDRSLLALPLAIEIARHSGARVDLVQVVVPVSVGEFGAGIDASYVSPDVYTEMMGDLEQVARDDLNAAARIAQQSRVDSTIHELVSTPSDGILRIADDVRADIIVMASRGRGGATRAFLGSVATGIVQRSKVPTIVVPAAAHVEAGDEGDIREVVRSDVTGIGRETTW
jgi:nucleotide-binding universal stress UspA family protein